MSEDEIHSQGLHVDLRPTRTVTPPVARVSPPDFPANILRGEIS